MNEGYDEGFLAAVNDELVKEGALPLVGAALSGGAKLMGGLASGAKTFAPKVMPAAKKLVGGVWGGVKSMLPWVGMDYLSNLGSGGEAPTTPVDSAGSQPWAADQQFKRNTNAVAAGQIGQRTQNYALGPRVQPYR